MEKHDYFIKGKYTIINEEIEDIGIDSVYESFVQEDEKKYLCKLIDKKSNQIKNDNIDNLIDFIQGKKNIYLFFNYLNGKTLNLYLKEKKVIKEEEIYIILDKIIDAILYLYHNNIILRDLKLENIFINRNGNILLCNLEKRNLLMRNKADYKFKNAYIKISLRIGMIFCKLIDFDNFSNYSKEKNINFVWLN